MGTTVHSGKEAVHVPVIEVLGRSALVPNPLREDRVRDVFRPLDTCIGSQLHYAGMQRFIEIERRENLDIQVPARPPSVSHESERIQVRVLKALCCDDKRRIHALPLALLVVGRSG